MHYVMLKLLKRYMLISALWIAVFVFWSLRTFAQDALWSRTYGGTSDDLGFSVEQTTDGGYIVAGESYSFGYGGTYGPDVYLIKTNYGGDPLWTRTYGGFYSDVGRSIQQTADGGYIVAGYTLSFGAGGYDVYLIKTNSTGDTLWTRTYGGTSSDIGYSVQQTTDGGYIVTGHTRSFGAGDYDAYLIKTDSLGDTLWTRTYGGSGWDEGYSVQQTTDGGYIIAGCIQSSGSLFHNVYLIKTDSSGDTVWACTYPGSGHAFGYSVQQTTDGGYILVGRTASSIYGPHDVYIVKTDSIGDTLWTRTYGGTGTDLGRSVQQTTDGSYVVTGSTRSFGDDSKHVYLIKTDSFGDTLWTRTYEGAGGYSVQQTADGGYIVTGSKYLGRGNLDVYLLKIFKARLGDESIYAYPNPFNPDLGPAYIRYMFRKDGKATIKIYDVSMRLVTILIENKQQYAGTEYRTAWEGKNDRGNSVANGVYFYRITSSSGESANGKIAVLR